MLNDEITYFELDPLPKESLIVRYMVRYIYKWTCLCICRPACLTPVSLNIQLNILEHSNVFILQPREIVFLGPGYSPCVPTIFHYIYPRLFISRSGMSSLSTQDISMICAKCTYTSAWEIPFLVPGYPVEFLKEQ
jgi:hypothetical protein